MKRQCKRFGRPRRSALFPQAEQLFGFERADIDSLMEFFDFAGEHVSVNQIGIILPDSSDLPFLEVAVAGRVDALITGNLRHFKPISGSHDVNVCTPAEFLERRN